MNNWFDSLCEKYQIKNLHPLSKVTIEIGGNVIYANINYTNSTTRIRIQFDILSNDELEKLNKLAEKKLINTYQLVNGIVPKDFEKSGIKILPDSLDDLEIVCPQENFTVDVLSVLKVFSKRLERNNLLIYKMRGFDFKKQIEYPVKKIDEIFHHKFETTTKKQLDDLYNVNIHLLKDLKYNKSLDFIYTEMFKKLIEDVDFFIPSYDLKWDSLTINLDDEYNIEANSKFKSTIELLFYIVDTDLKDIFYLTRNLVKHNAIIPELFLSKNIAQIRWIPSLYDENVVGLCKSYLKKIPDNLLHFKNKKLPKEEQLIGIISLIIDGLFKFSFRGGDFKVNPNISETNINLLRGYKIEMKNPTQLKTLNSLSRSLSPLYLKELNFTYALVISRDLEIEIKIKNEHKLRKLQRENEFKFARVIYDLFTQFKIKNTIYEKIKLTDKDFIVFSRKILPILKYINVEVINDFEIVESDIKLVMDCDLTPDEFNLKNLKKIKWLVKFQDNLISIDEFLNYKSEVVMDSNTYYVLESKKFKEISIIGRELVNISDENYILKLALLENYGEVEFEVTDSLKKLINPSSIYEVPDTLTGNLRAYQKIGFSWLVQNIKSGFGSILADDMGLGKTLQVLTCILYFKKTNFIDDETSLIIVPPTLLSNWEHEIKKFTPELTYYIYHGHNRKFPLTHYDIILTSYSIIRIDLELFLDTKWFICILDEAQNIKNPQSQQTRAIKNINAFNKIALTGTPIENRLTDYWSIFDFTNKNYFSSINDFKSDYIIPIEKLENDDAVDSLKKVAKPFVLRRLKSDSDIKKQLPEKIVNDVYATLSKKQIRLYEAILDGIFEEIDTKKGIERRGTILQTITALKQACNHPAQYLKSENPKVSESGKMELLINLLENILDMDEKVIIFTQYVKMGEIIKEIVSKKLKEEVLFLHGSLTPNQKTKIINTFQENKDFKILVATLKTGGVGLNLTAAQNVIHYDLWWNPAVENQATDRVHRIGQENDVMVYRFITKGTLEEEIDKISKTKADLAKKAISNDETFITELSTEELKEILSLRL